LERRRHAYDQAMWQAPALTIAGQAFLLRILADEGSSGGRAVVLLAGVVETPGARALLPRVKGGASRGAPQTRAPDDGEKPALAPP
jgi:hypothetical protein